MKLDSWRLEKKIIFFSKLQTVWFLWDCSNDSLRFLWNLMWPVVAHPHQGLMFCAWNAFLLTSGVQGYYLTYLYLAGISNQSDHFPLTSITVWARHFHPRNWMFFYHHSVQEEISSQQFLKHWTQSQRWHFFLILMFDVNINWSSWPVQGQFVMRCDIATGDQTALVGVYVYMCKPCKGHHCLFFLSILHTLATGPMAVFQLMFSTISQVYPIVFLRWQFKWQVSQFLWWVSFCLIKCFCHSRTVTFFFPIHFSFTTISQPTSNGLVLCFATHWHCTTRLCCCWIWLFFFGAYMDRA